jgi:hypothetical protein
MKKIMAKNDDFVCCLLCSSLLCSCVFKNISISNFSVLNCSFNFFNKYFSLFSSHLLSIKLNDDVVVPIAGWCVSKIFFYMSVLVMCIL